MRQCLFCNNTANSREELIGKAIIKRLPQDRGLLVHSIGGGPKKKIERMEMKMRSVCAQCNNGWMSDLEKTNIHTLGCLMADLQLTLNAPQQRSIALWAMKTMMVGDGSLALEKRGGSFFTKTEREALRLTAAIPSRTLIWLGRFIYSGLLTVGTDVRLNLPDGPNTGYGCLDIIIIGHLIIQSLTFRVSAEYENRTVEIKTNVGPWDKLLIQIWPTLVGGIVWPPAESFSKRGQFPIGMLPKRWKVQG